MLDPATTAQPLSEERAPDLVAIDLRGTVQTLFRMRWRLFWTSAAGLAIGILLALIIPPYYAGHAVFLPPKNADMLSLAGSGESATSLLLGGGTTKSDVYLGLLQSRTVADMVIDRTGLMQEYKAKLRVDAEARLARASTFKVSKNSLIEVTVDARTPQLAADITNAYLDALFQLNGDMATSGSAFRRNFFEQQLAEQKKALSDAENALKDVQQSSGIVLPTGEAMAGISATADLQAQINGVETQLAGLTSGATDENPRVVQSRRQLAQLRAQLAQQQAAADSKGITSNRSLPGVTLVYEQRLREVKLRVLLYEAMVKEYERARISASDPGPQLQIVDRAVVPERKAGPPRRLFALVGMLLGFLMGLGYFIGREPMQRAFRFLGEDPTPVGR